MDGKKNAILSVVRSILIAAGGWAVGKGYISEPGLQELVGAVMVIASAAWGAIDKLGKE